VGSQNKHTGRDPVTPVCNVLLFAQTKPRNLQILSQNINTQYALSTLFSDRKQVFCRNDTVQTDKFLTLLFRLSQPEKGLNLGPNRRTWGPTV